MPESEKKTKKPSNTAFKQQRLKSWQPLLTPKAVIPTFLIVGTIFLPVGIGLFVASNNVKQVVMDYTNCYLAPSTFVSVTGPDAGNIKEWKFDRATSTCTMRFNVPQQMELPVFLYYRLHNFYQNHRKYVKSFNADQLSGKKMNAADLTSCSPLGAVNAADNITFTDGTAPGPNAQYYPCGLIANSLFSDEISSLLCYQSDFPFENGVVCSPTSGATFLYEFKNTGIAWPSDKDKYGKTAWASETDEVIKRNLVPPPEWMKAWPERFGNGYNSSNLPNLASWEQFQVWMRTAGLYTFRKLYGRNDFSALPAGIWQISVKGNFDVVRFGGTKSLVISTVSILGGKNPFLGIAYMVVGVVCLLLGVLFLARNMIKPRKLGDHSHLSWNKEQNSS